MAYGMILFAALIAFDQLYDIYKKHYPSKESTEIIKNPLIESSSTIEPLEDTIVVTKKREQSQRVKKSKATTDKATASSKKDTVITIKLLNVCEVIDNAEIKINGKTIKKLNYRNQYKWIEFSIEYFHDNFHKNSISFLKEEKCLCEFNLSGESQFDISEKCKKICSEN